METIIRDIDLTEIIDGVEVMTPSPYARHQQIIRNIYDLISECLKINRTGELYFSPLDVIFEEGISRLQPDLLYIKRENMGILQDWIRGIPDMVCEIVSAHSYDRDVSVKKGIYERYGVPEYWIVLPELEIIEIMTIENDRYRIFSHAVGSGRVVSSVIDGLVLDIEKIFA